MAVTLPDSTSVQQIQTRQYPGVNVPGATPSGLTELGSAINQVASTFQAANDARVLSNLEAQTAKEYANFQKRLDEDPDSFNQWGEQFEEFSRTHREEMKKSGASRNVLDAWERSVTPIEARTRLKVMSKARETMVDKGLTELKTNLQSVQDLAITGSKDERNLYVSQADLMIERAQNTGFIRDSTAEELRQGFRSGTEKARFMNAVNLDPELAKEALDAGDFEVPETERPAWEKTVNQAIETKNNQERINQERAEKEREKILKAEREQVEISFIERLDSDNPPTLQEINQSSLDANHKLQWRILLQSNAKEGSALNKEVYAGLTVAINGESEYNGEIVTKDTILNHARIGDLTPEATEHLLDRLEKVRNPKTPKDSVREKSIRLATGMLDTYKKNGMFAEDLGENTVAHARAVDEVVKWAEANPDSNPIDYVEKNLAPALKTSWFERLLSRVGSTMISGIPGFSPSGAPKEEPVEETGNRDEAIRFLRANGKMVSEQTIKQAMDYLNGRQ